LSHIFQVLKDHLILFHFRIIKTEKTFHLNYFQTPMEGLQKRWTLTKAPLACSQRMLSNVVIKFGKETFEAYDTEDNGTSGPFLVDSANGVSGTILCDPNGWDETCCEWETEEEERESRLANHFIQSSLGSPFYFRLEDNKLFVVYQNQEYEFYSQ